MSENSRYNPVGAVKIVKSKLSREVIFYPSKSRVISFKPIKLENSVCNLTNSASPNLLALLINILKL